MSIDSIIKISNDKKLYNYLKNNSYWFKYLNRSKDNYNNFYKAYKSDNRTERINKASGVVDTLDTVNTIFKMFN